MARAPKTLRGMVHRAVYGVRSGRSNASMTPEQSAAIDEAVKATSSTVSRAVNALLLTLVAVPLLIALVVWAVGRLAPSNPELDRAVRREAPSVAPEPPPRHHRHRSGDTRR